MIKTILTPTHTDVYVSIPQDYVGKKVEVLVYAVDELVEKQPAKSTMAKYQGLLSEETTKALQKHVTESRNEWDRDF